MRFTDKREEIPMPKYSFIVPVYNCGSWLAPCVDSLLAQSFRDFEILLIDDGTPDNGSVLCDELAAKHACIRAFHKENGGAASARNYGVDRAEGEYLLFIDGDDTIEPDTLERIEAVNGVHPDDLVIFGMAFDYYDQRNVLERVEHLSIRHQGLYTKDFFVSNFKTLFDDNALSSACNKVFSVRILRQTGLRFREDMTLYEDLEFVLRYFGAVEQFYCINMPLYHYRIDSVNFSHKRARQLSGMQENLDLLAGTILVQNPLPAGTADLMANLYMQLLLRHLLVTKYQKRGLDAVYSYCDDAQFRRCLEMGASLGEQEAVLLEMITSCDRSRLLSWLRKKRANIALRRTVKQALKTLGLRR